MIEISVRWDIDAVLRRVKAAERQIPFATAKALTRTAIDARRDVMDALPKVFDRPNPFTMRGIGYRQATKATLSAAVFIRDKQAEYLSRQIAGGTRRPRRRALALPTTAPLDRYGNVQRGWWQRMRNRRDVFSGTVRGIPGIWQRSRDGLKLLLAFAPKADYEARFDFVGIVRKNVGRNFQRHFRESLEAAMRTAR